MSTDLDERPPVWIGHAGPVVVPDLNEAIAFYERIGLRWIHGSDQIAALQLRGGTHLVLLPGEPPQDGAEAPFDLMVDDLESAHARATADGLDPSPVESAKAHSRYWITDPGGTRIRVHDSHVVGPA